MTRSITPMHLVVMAALTHTERGVSGSGTAVRDAESRAALMRLTLLADLVGLVEVHHARLDALHRLLDVVVDAVEDGALLYDQHVELAEEGRQLVDGLRHLDDFLHAVLALLLDLRQRVLLLVVQRRVGVHDALHHRVQLARLAPGRSRTRLSGLLGLLQPQTYRAHTHRAEGQTQVRGQGRAVSGCTACAGGEWVSWSATSAADCRGTPSARGGMSCSAC